METRHVLVADDEPHIGRIIKMKLEQGPFRVTLAYDGREALDVLEREHDDIALVLLDLMMPHLSGLDVLRDDARGSSDWKHLPCIILTAAGQEQQHRLAMELGASEFLTKPFSPKKLYARAAELAGIARGEQRQRAREPLGRRPRRRRRLALLAAQHAGAPEAAAAARRRRSRCSPTRCGASRPLVPPERTLVLTNARSSTRCDACVPTLPARTSSPSRGRRAPRAALAWARASRSRAAMRTRRGDDLRARRLGDRRRGRISRDARARARSVAEQHARARHGRRRARRVPTRASATSSRASRSGRARAASRGSSRSRTARAPRRWCATGTSGTPASSCGASATSSTSARAHARGRAGARAAHAATTSTRFFAAVRADRRRRRRARAQRARARAAGRLRLGRRRHVGGAAPRARARRAGQRHRAGSVHALDARDNVVHAERERVVLYGVHDLVVVTATGPHARDDDASAPPT